MDVANCMGHETEEGDDTSNTMQEEVLAQDNLSHDKSQARQDTGIVSSYGGGWCGGQCAGRPNCPSDRKDGGGANNAFRTGD